MVLPLSSPRSCSLATSRRSADERARLHRRREAVLPRGRLRRHAIRYRPTLDAADDRQALRRDGEALRVRSRRSTSTPARAFFAPLRPGEPADDGRLSVRRRRPGVARSSRIPTRARSRRSRSSTPAIRRGSRSSTKKQQLAPALHAIIAPRSPACSRSTTRRARTCASSRWAASPASCRSTSPA